MNEQTQYKWLPSEPTEAMINAVIKAGLDASGDKHVPNYDEVIDVLKLVYSAVWQAAPEVEQEPVVYLVWHDGEFTYTKYPEEYQNTYEALPLYTHPQPKQPEQSLDMVKREPLSNNAIQQLIVNNGGSMLEFARAIEKAHGIGVE